MSAIPGQNAPPTAESLRQLALRYLGRFAATEQGVARVLDRAVMRWARKAASQGDESEYIEAVRGESRAVIAAIITDMRRVGALDDPAFARSRSVSLTRAGRSRRAIAARLTQSGIEQDVLGAAMEEALGSRGDESARDKELGAALVLARKRRLGPFKRAQTDHNGPEAHMRALAVFARAGFSRDVAEQAIGFDLEGAEDRIMALKLS